MSNSWVVSAEECSSDLLELLWVRQAWGLEVTGGPPELMVAPELVSKTLDDTVRRSWEVEWLPIWESALVNEGEEAPPLQLPFPSAVARITYERSQVGPWRSRFGDAAADGTFADWRRGRLGEHRDAPLVQLPSSIAPLMKRAEEADLRRLVILPCGGKYAVRSGRHTLVASWATTHSNSLLALSLKNFAASSADWGVSPLPLLAE